MFLGPYNNRGNYWLRSGQGGVEDSAATLFIFYKNKVYKNAEPQICWKAKNILYAEKFTNDQMFLLL